MTSVLLLRSPAEEAEDRYELAFRNAGYRPVSIPVLETLICHSSELAEYILSKPREIGIFGVIVTSKRSCEALGAALKASQQSMQGLTNAADWSQIPFYVVGETTASSLRDIFDAFGPYPVDIRGQHSGNAENLASFILGDLKSEGSVKLLYLTGDKNRDTITRILSDSSIELQLLQVYETKTSSSFRSNLKRTMEASPGEKIFWWIVFFAPSAAVSVSPILQEYFAFKHNNSSVDRVATEEDKIFAKICAIGPTSKVALQDDLGLMVDAVASKPTPDNVVTAVTDVDRK
ncbi:tetrapyrrole biosynthesis, uroporphyrinogen III synthase [Crepidotus variabilis]|uniref:Tetrapyrrole biosynthesis, uroporphyrinogen III synthase n=1 Tax=Crepidotus variabilis TaxID=179855 RepID=A0A9P6EGY1_9AGAR|nr:tetrapyrrole biosynthesis, uroporphyrinogen III synthase [Crepidotus variabilis]